MYNAKAFSLKIALKKKKKENFRCLQWQCSGGMLLEKLVAGHSQGLTMAYTMELFLLLVGGISCW